MRQTTATLQTPPGRGGIAVIELAGPACDREKILATVFRPLNQRSAGADGDLQLGYLMEADRRIDQAIVCRRGGRVEINIHGGPQVARAAMIALQAGGAVAAPPPPSAPESFLPAHDQWNNPAIGVELLDSLPLARSELVVSALTRQWSAGISRLVRTILDAGSEADSAAANSLTAAAEAIAVMARLMNPPQIVLAGPPNVGKSMLANAIVGRQVSIVHDTAGTTRDWVCELALLDGVPIWLTDTAGLWHSDVEIDAEAVRRAHDRAQQADLVVLVGADRAAELPHWWRSDNVLRVAAKCDEFPPAGPADVVVSAVTGEGMDQLRQKIRAALSLDAIDPAAAMAFTPRQADILIQAAQAIRSGDHLGSNELLHHLLGG